MSGATLDIDDSLTSLARDLISKQLTRVSLFRRSNPERFEALLFHGTARMCCLAESLDQRSLCSWPSCKLCGVINQSFSVAECGTSFCRRSPNYRLKHHSTGRKNKFTRFGKGIYTTSSSSSALLSRASEIDTISLLIQKPTPISNKSKPQGHKSSLLRAFF